MIEFKSDEQEAAHYGALLLDERAPGWYKRIYKSSLNMASEVECVLGQLYLTYHYGARELFDNDETALEAHGFYIGDEDRGSYKKLTECWQQEIDKRLSA